MQACSVCLQFSEGVAAERHYFASALADPETCQLVLEIILGKKLPKVNVHAEHSVYVNSDFRSARLDIYANDEVEVSYNVESQIKDEHNLPKRSRHYQAELDTYSLKPGMEFEELKPIYIIFICTFDPFGDDLYRYTFCQRCDENGRALEDGAYRIFLNTKGKNVEDVPNELINFLGYMEQSTDEYAIQTKDEAITKLHSKVTQLKKWRRLENSYMTGEELIKSHEKSARSEGRAEGKAEAFLNIICGFLEELGEIPETLMQRLAAETDTNTQSAWTKLAAKSSSIEEFIEKI